MRHRRTLLAVCSVNGALGMLLAIFSLQQDELVASTIGAAVAIGSAICIAKNHPSNKHEDDT